jgi:putative endonuclease
VYGRSWFVYIVRCADHSLYTGVTTDIERRLNEHNNSRKLAAAYTRSRRPVTLMYKERVSSRSIALKREYEIKQMSSRSKELLIKDNKI